MALPTGFNWYMDPDLEVVREGGVVRFSARHDGGVVGHTRNDVRWMVRREGEGEEAEFFRGERLSMGSNPEYRHEHTFERPGRYRVALEWVYSGQHGWHTVFVTVEAESRSRYLALREALGPEGEDFPDPNLALSVARRYRDCMEAMQCYADDPESPVSMTSGQRRRHREDMDRYNNYINALQGIVSRRWRRGHSYRCVATLSPEGGAERPQILRLFLVDTGRRESAGAFSRGGVVWKLVDWTNPLEPTMRGHYDGVELTAPDACRAAIDNWIDNNRYPPGRLMIRAEPGCPLRGDVGGETDGQTSLASLSGWLDRAALGLAITAGVVTLLAPVPGSRLVSAAIWVSVWGGVAASSTAAAIRIYERHHSGDPIRWQDDAMDGLTIVANLFSAGAAARWRQGSQVLARVEGARRAQRFLLMGQIGADATQGVLVLADEMEHYDEIMQDGSLTPRQRTNRLLQLFASLASQGAMFAVSMRSTRAELDQLDRAGPRRDPRTPRERADALNDPDGEVVDLTPRPPEAEADVEDGGVSSTVARGSRPRPAVDPPPAETPRRGMRVQDDPDTPRPTTQDGQPVSEDLYYDAGPEMRGSREELGYDQMERRRGRDRMRRDRAELEERTGERIHDPFEDSAEGAGSYGELASYRYLYSEGLPQDAIEVGERQVARALGIDYGNPPPKMADLLQTRGASRDLIPTEVKNQTEVHLSGSGNAALAKFREIMERAPAAIRRRISRFEIIANLTSELPGSFAVTEAGELWQAMGGYWEPVRIGGKPVFVRRADLGTMWDPAAQARVRRALED